MALELHAERVVVYPQVSVVPAGNRLWTDLLHFLRDHADIGLIAAVVAEAIEAKTVLEMSEKDDVMLKPDIGSPSATASTTTPTTTTEATPAAPAGPHTAAANVRPTASRTHIGRPGRATISGSRVVPPATRSTLRRPGCTLCGLGCALCRPRIRTRSIGLTPVCDICAFVWTIAFASIS